MSVRILFARFGISALGFLGVGLTGALLVAHSDFRSALSGLLWVVVIMLVIAVRNTWDLLVTVADRTQSSSRPQRPKALDRRDGGLRVAITETASKTRHLKLL